MKILYELFAVVITATITENLIFARALGVDGIIKRTRSYRNIIRLGLMTCAVSVLGGIFCYFFKHILSQYHWWGLFRGAFVLLSVILAYFIITLLLGLRKLRTEHELPVIGAFSGATVGAVLVALLSTETFFQTIAYCIGCSLGLMIAMMLIHSGRERLELCKVPRAFSGLPITMVYIGILSLAIYGLIGHQLPT